MFQHSFHILLSLMKCLGVPLLAHLNAHCKLQLKCTVGRCKLREQTLPCLVHPSPYSQLDMGHSVAYVEPEKHHTMVKNRILLLLLLLFNIRPSWPTTGITHNNVPTFLSLYKVKVVPKLNQVPCCEDVWGNGSTDPYICNLDTR